jgi:hypothetical protein
LLALRNMPLWRGLPSSQLRSSWVRERCSASQLMHLLAHENRCLEDQANASEIVRNVRIICRLTRRRSGLTGTTATGAGGARSWSFLAGRYPPNPCQGAVELSFASTCAWNLRSAVVQRSQTGLTANSQGFRIGARERSPS